MKLRNLGIIRIKMPAIRAMNGETCGRKGHDDLLGVLYKAPRGYNHRKKKAAPIVGSLFVRTTKLNLTEPLRSFRPGFNLAKGRW